jgi:hypothetical protein
VTLAVMNTIKSLTRVLRRRHPRDSEPRGQSPAWLTRVERRLDEGDVLMPDDLVRIREYLASLERSGPIPTGR